jgi:hypothetical protein
MIDNKPTDTAQELENIRRERSAQFFDDSTKKVVDNDTNNSYNDTNPVKAQETQSANQEPQTGQATTEDLEKYRKVFEDTFGGDGSKAAKSWAMSQSEYNKLRQQYNEAKKAQEQLTFLETRLSSNPELFDIVQKYLDGEETDKNLLSGKKQEAQVAKPAEVVNKLSLEDDVDISEESLAKAGYLDSSLKKSMPQLEWERYVLQAQRRYLPRLIANQAAKETIAQIEHTQSEKQKQVYLEQAKRTNSDRLEQGIESAVLSYGLDFTGKDAELLDEIYERAGLFRDPKDPQHLIRPNAVKLALIEIAEERGMPLTTVQPPTTQAKNLFDGANPNRTNSVPKSSGKMTQEEEFIAKNRQRRWADAERVATLHTSRKS